MNAILCSSAIFHRPLFIFVRNASASASEAKSRASKIKKGQRAFTVTVICPTAIDGSPSSPLIGSFPSTLTDTRRVKRGGLFINGSGRPFPVPRLQGVPQHRDGYAERLGDFLWRPVPGNQLRRHVELIQRELARTPDMLAPALCLSPAASFRHCRLTPVLIRSA